MDLADNLVMNKFRGGDEQIRYSPVAVFAYKRPNHLARMLNSLLTNPEAAWTDVVIFCDGARGERDEQSVAEVRALAGGVKGFSSVRVVSRSRNLGLAESIISGVTAMLQEYDRVIVLEDDLLLSPHFLRYMNDGLGLYERDECVASVHGYCYPVSQSLPETFFLRGADCWGWATWSRAWKHFRADGGAMLAELTEQNLLQDFDAYYPFSQMLRDQIAGRNNSWAVRWHAATFLRGMLTLYPGRSLVHNTGNDGSGTHSGDTQIFLQNVADNPVLVRRLPLHPSAEARDAYRAFFGLRGTLHVSWWLRLSSWFMRWRR